MESKIFDSELKIMEILWSAGELPARDIAALAAEQVGWSKTTTYTVLKKCVEKGLLERDDPGFRCRPLVTRQDAQRRETRDLIDRMEVLSLLDEAVGSTASMDAVSIGGDTVQLQFSGVTLAQTAQIVKALEASPIVAYTMVNTAATTQLDGAPADASAPVQASVLIQLQKEVSQG